MSMVLRAIKGITPETAALIATALGLYFRDQQVATFGVFDSQGIGASVPSEGYTHAVPIQAICRCPIRDVRLPPMGNFDAILLVHHATIVSEVEFVDIDVKTLPNGRRIEVLAVPGEHLLHAINHVRDAELFRLPEGP